MAHKIHKWTLFLAFACMAIAAQAQRDARYHIVEEGQTLYSIARLYSISPSELQKLNPKAGDFIRPGDKLRLPDGAQAKAASGQQQVASGPGAQFVSGVGQQSTQGTKGKIKTTYQIKKKDTLYRIALEYGVTIQDILEVNPGLTEEGKLKKGEWLSIPYTRAERQAEEERAAAERAKAEAAARKSHKSHLNVAVILPLKENTERGGKMIEFYQGMLMAADSVRKQGTSVDIYAYNSGSSVAELNSILDKDELKHMDAIFGPLDGVQANILNNFSKTNKVRLVMPFATTNTYGGSNPYAYIISAQADVVNHNAAAFVAKQFAGHNIVCMNAGNADNRGNAFNLQLKEQLSSRGITPRQAVDAEADAQVLSAQLSASRPNLIVLNTSAQNALQKAIKTLTAFIREHPEYKVSLLGYPEWSTYQGSIVKSFHELDTYIYTPFYRNNDARMKAHELRFKNNFGHELIKTSPRYGLMGQDVAYYFLHGMAELGDYFDERQQKLSYNPLQNGLLFQKPNGNQPYTNISVSLVHYTTGGNIEVQRTK